MMTFDKLHSFTPWRLNLIQTSFFGKKWSLFSIQTSNYSKGGSSLLLFYLVIDPSRIPTPFVPFRVIQSKRIWRTEHCNLHNWFPMGFQNQFGEVFFSIIQVSAMALSKISYRTFRCFLKRSTNTPKKGVIHSNKCRKYKKAVYFPGLV